jgi:hypothetical protein
MTELRNKNITILANFFNPSVFNSLWFVKNGILKEEDINAKTSFQSPDISQVNTSTFSLIVVLNQLVFHVIDDNEAKSIEILNKMISALPHTPYTAMGINFVFDAPALDTDLSEYSRKLFFYPESKLHSLFNTQDAKFGVYLSKNVNGSRLKLDIKPATISDANGSINKEVITYAFNFHKDLNKDNPVNDLLDLIKKWGEYKKNAEEIINVIYS